ncbi:MAG TPA: phosphate ABC transporter substrate-binding protein PstS [Streptosporangiaceae bacterium]
MAVAGQRGSAAFGCGRLLLTAAVLPVTLAVALAACTAAPAAIPAGAPAAAPSATGQAIPQPPAAQHVALSETGSTLLFPLLHAWAGAYQQQFPQVSISTHPTGSGTGINAASAGTVDIGSSDAFLSSGDLVKNPALLNIPLAVAAQQVNYNLPGVKPGVHLRLTGSVLAQMYQGTIRTWNNPAIAALNPGVPLPGTRIVPLHRSDSSGDTFLFTSYLSTHAPSWNRLIGYGTTVAWPPVPGSQGQHGNSGMVTGCQATPGCIAYVGISYLSTALADGLGEAQLANELGQYELPTPASISAGVAAFVSATPANETISMVNGPASGGYPIVNYEYAIVRSQQPDRTRARDIRAFLHWAVTTGNAAQYLRQGRFQPLPSAVVTLSDQQIAKIR